MSCTPTSFSLGRSLSPLSPSDESRFVPHPSVSSIMEGHFTKASSPNQPEIKVDTNNVQDQDDNNNAESGVSKTTDDSNLTTPRKKSNLIEEEEEETLVGATICFTPEPSPRSSPNLRGIGGDAATAALPNIDSLNSNSNDYIGSVAVPSGSNSKMGSSVMHVASSLDGRSTTEYEILDGISSKGTIEVEELIIDDDDEDCDAPPSLDEKKTGNKNEGRNEMAAMLSNPTSGGDVNNAFKSPHPTNDTNNQVPAFVSTNSNEALKLDLSSDDTLNEEPKKDSDSTSTSPKVDERPLTPFKNLHKFWEGQSNFTHMTKSMIGRILGTDTPKEGVDLDDATAQDAKKTDHPDVDTKSTGGGGEESAEKRIQPSGTHVDELNSSGQQVDHAIQVQPTRNKFSLLPFAATMLNALSVLAGTAATLFVSASILVGMFMHGHISSIIGNVRALIVRILTHKFKRAEIAQDTNEVEKVLQDMVDRVAKSSEAPPSEQPVVTNLSKLFVDEASNGNESSSALEPKEKVLLKRINDMVTTSVVTKCKKALSALKANKAVFAIASFALISIFLMSSYMLQSGTTGVVHESKDDISIHLDVMGVHIQEDLHCVSTNTATFVGIPLWELLLSPTLFEGFEDQALNEGMYWLSTFVVLSVLSSLFCAYIFKSEIPFLSTKSNTGIWSEEEHQQFLAGYNEHGGRWKLVSAYVPTRTYTQVKTHGCYWLKIRSPVRMAKARKLTPTRTSFGSSIPASARSLLTPKTPSSVSSTTSTPKKSNKKAKTPTIKGILVEQDHNKTYKNVTPRSESRTKRMQKMKMKGSKSDPVKRVRIRSP